MDPELQEVKRLRSQLGLTQKELARLARVSQSLVAKVEAGTVDPSYSAGRRMLDTLRGLRRQGEKTAGELMQRHTVTCRPEERLTTAITRMGKRAISQLPVAEGENVTGLLTESGIVRNMAHIDHASTLVREVMEEAPPIIPPTTPLRVAAELLSCSSLLIVKERGRMKGIVTKADLLKAV